jgi:hypothetical protein
MSSSKEFATLWNTAVNKTISNILETENNNFIDAVRTFLLMPNKVSDDFEEFKTELIIELAKREDQLLLDFPQITEDKYRITLDSITRTIVRYVFNANPAKGLDKTDIGYETIEAIKDLDFSFPTLNLLENTKDHINYIERKIASEKSKMKNVEPNKIPTSIKQHKRIKVNLSVPQLAYLFKLLSDSKPDIFDIESKNELYQFISENFTTKAKDEKEISIKSLRNLFSDTDKKVADFWIEHLKKMLEQARKL